MSLFILIMFNVSALAAAGNAAWFYHTRATNPHAWLNLGAAIFCTLVSMMMVGQYVCSSLRPWLQYIAYK